MLTIIFTPLLFYNAHTTKEINSDFTLRIVSSTEELLLLLYKSGFYRRE